MLNWWREQSYLNRSLTAVPLLCNPSPKSPHMLAASLGTILYHINIPLMRDHPIYMVCISFLSVSMGGHRSRGGEGAGSLCINRHWKALYPIPLLFLCANKDIEKGRNNKRTWIICVVCVVRNGGGRKDTSRMEIMEWSEISSCSEWWSD